MRALRYGAMAAQAPMCGCVLSSFVCCSDVLPDKASLRPEHKTREKSHYESKDRCACEPRKRGQLPPSPRCSWG